MVIAQRTMVRPWMVALLVLLTGRRSFGDGSLQRSPVAASREDEATAGEVVNATDIASIGCYYKGRSYDPGTLVSTDQPCLKCTCVTGSLVCHLQVCPEMPDPPPQGCVVVHKKAKCCAQLQCNYEQFGVVHSKLFPSQTNSRSGPARIENAAIVTFDVLPKGCVANGTVYAEGSAMDSSSLCEYCYCIKGRQQCVRPHCSLTIPGCAAVYKKHTCCPIRYKCLPQNPTIENTTNAPTTTEMASSLYSRFKDCRINGRLISLGEPVIGVARSSCETCFCINGQVRCDKVICPPIRAQISPNCGPVFTEGHCCPTSYDCANATAAATATHRNSETPQHVSSATTATTTTARTTTTTAPPSTVTVPEDNVVRLSSSPPPTTTATLMETENALSASLLLNSKTTTESMTDDPMESRHGNPAGLVLDEFGDLNVAEKANNFQMDYDGPTLPPSLPNLKIIRFEAADAVVDKPAPVYDNYQPVVERVYNVSDIAEEQPPSLVINSFSPPIETEGGFVPKDSPAETVYNVPNKIRTTSERVPIQQTTAVHVPYESVTGHQPIGSGWCAAKGKKYKHGELLTDPSACNICVCFNAKIVCQENCPAVKVGCQRVSDPNNSTCCGRIVCNEVENDSTVDRVTETTTSTAESPPTGTKTRDAVIEHIVYSAPPTLRPAAATSSAAAATSSAAAATSSAAAASAKPAAAAEPTASTAKPAAVEPRWPASDAAKTPSATVTAGKPTVAPGTAPPAEIATAPTTPKPPADEDYSFESMFSYFFGEEQPPAATTSPPPPPPPSTAAAPEAAAETRVEHRTDDETGDQVGPGQAKPQSDFASLVEQMFGAVPDSDGGPALAEAKPNRVDEPQRQGFEDRADVEPLATDAPRRPEPRPQLSAAAQSRPEDGERRRPGVAVEERPAGIGPQTRPDAGAAASGAKRRPPRPGAKPPRPDAAPESAPHRGTAGGPAIQRRPQPELQQQQTASKPPNVVVRPSASPPAADAGLDSLAPALKVSGCNVYGRMYGVGKTVPELSTLCRECMCTDVGVHCSPLKC